VGKRGSWQMGYEDGVDDGYGSFSGTTLR